MTNIHGRIVVAASDGACSGNPGPGGWGALIRYEDGAIEEFGGHEKDTTNNRMELQAALEIFKRLKHLPRHPQMTIKTDSKYLIDGLAKWIKNWKNNGWKTASGKPVLNKDLWQSLDLVQLKDVKLQYVKGHSGDIDNERVDKIAVSYSKRTYIKLKSVSTTKKNSDMTQQGSYHEEPSPKFQQLLSRLDIVNEMAKNGYSLSNDELSELLNISSSELQQKQQSWKWRDWTVEPIKNSRWRLQAISEQVTPKQKLNE